MYSALNKRGLTDEGDSHKVIKGEGWRFHASEDEKEVGDSGLRAFPVLSIHLGIRPEAPLRRLKNPG